MLDSHGLILFLLWLLAAAGIFLFVRWLNQFLERYDLESDTRRLIVIAFTGIVLFGVLNFLWDISASISNKSSAATNTIDNNKTTVPEEEVPDVNTFIQTYYPTLHTVRVKLGQRRQFLHVFFQHVNQLARDTPHMRDFLQEVIDIRWDTQKDLARAENDVNLSLQQFWAVRSTGDKIYTDNKFSDITSQLTDTIKDTLAFDTAQLAVEQKKIRVMLEKTSQQLENDGIPPDPDNRLKPLVFEPYREPQITLLYNWLGEHHQPGVVHSIEKLLENQKQIETRAATLQTFLKEHPNAELHKVMQSVMDEWKATSRYNQYALYQILYATELLYMLNNIMDTDTDSGQEETRLQTTELLKHLQQKAPILADLAEKKRTEGVERSYSPTLFSDGKQH